MADSRRLDALNGLRFVACLQVAFAHMPFLHADESVNATLRRCLIGPGFAVPFFFAMSGFVLAYRYHERFRTLSTGESYRFYLARLARVWPVHLLTLCLAVYYSPNPRHVNQIDSAIINALMIQSWVPSLTYAHSYNSTAWTLSIEVFFYVCCPFLLWGLTRRTISTPGLLALVVPAWMLPAGLAVYLSYHPHPWSIYLVGLCPVARLGEFVIGLLFGLIFVRRGWSNPPPSTVPSAITWTIVEVGIVSLLVAEHYFMQASPLLLQLNGYYTLPSAFLILIFAMERGYFSKMLASKGPAYLGDISYAFFMIHCIVFVFLNRLFPGEMGTWSRVSLYLQAAAAAAVVLYHGFELPMGSLVLSLGGRRQRLNREIIPKVETA